MTHLPHFVHTSVSGAGEHYRNAPGWKEGRWDVGYWEDKAYTEQLVRDAGFRSEIARILGEAWKVSPEAPDFTPEEAVTAGMPPAFVRNYQMMDELGSPATLEQARSLGLPLTDFRTWAHSMKG
ncbi:MAG: hypothetical protein ABW123_06430 [Cystobacter sp.]